MVKKQKQSKKNKGPKGKKARSKAKLDKQWGETVIYDQGRDDSRRASTRRHQRQEHKQRVHESNSLLSIGKEREVILDGGKSSTVATSFTSTNSVITDPLSSHSFSRRQGRQHHQGRAGSSRNHQNDEESDSEEDNDAYDSNPLDGLLSMIRRQSVKKKNLQKREYFNGRPGQKNLASSSDIEKVDYHSDDDDDDDEERKARNSDDDDDDDDDSTGDGSQGRSDDVSNSSEAADDDVAMDDDNNQYDDNDDDKSVDGMQGVQSTIDIFRRRFNQPPMAIVSLEGEGSTKAPVSTKKIALGSGHRHSSSSAELHVSIPNYERLEMTTLMNPRDEDNNSINNSNQKSGNIIDELIQDIESNQDNHELKTGRRNWQQIASDTFQSTNRSILQRQWEKLHGFSGLVPPQSQRNENDYDDQYHLHAAVYSFLARYSDMLIPTVSTSSSPNQKRMERQSFQQIYLLHILNHVLTTRSRIQRNNRVLKQRDEDRLADSSKESSDFEYDREQIDITEQARQSNGDNPDRFRDQGFTRPSVLVLLPTRGICHRFVEDLYRLCGSGWNDDIKSRFDSEYGPITVENVDDSSVKNDDDEVKFHRKSVLDKKGKEWNELFGDTANDDDDFKIGISVTPKVAGTHKTTTPSMGTSSKVALRLYTDFYKSDIIVASPLGLRMIITRNENSNDSDLDDKTNGTKEQGRNPDFDFLSSIEICLIENSDTILMQNWDHVNNIMEYLNRNPQNNNATDFSRVRNYLLDGQGAFWRQIIVSTQFLDPALNSTFKRFGRSLSGSVRVRRRIANEDAAISKVLVSVRQVFQKIDASSPMDQGQWRVDFFLKTILPQIERQNQTHTLVFIPSYFDFCAVRNALLKRDVSFVSVTEYSRISEVGRGRARFLQGRKHIMLYTGRAHYFHRHAIRGARHIIFIGVPEHCDFYSDHVNLIGESMKNRATSPQNMDTTVANPSCLVLFTKYEAYALERLVGTSNCNRMLSGSKSTFMFDT